MIYVLLSLHPSLIFLLYLFWTFISVFSLIFYLPWFTQPDFLALPIVSFCLVAIEQEQHLTNNFNLKTFNIETKISPKTFLYLRLEKYFFPILFAESNKIWKVITFFRVIWNETDFRFVPNQTENGYYNPDSEVYFVCVIRVFCTPRNKIVSLVESNGIWIYLQFTCSFFGNLNSDQFLVPKSGVFPINDLQTPLRSGGHIYMKDEQCTETNEKSFYNLCDF